MPFRFLFAVLLLPTVVATLAVTKFVEECTFDDKLCQVACPRYGVQDLETLMLDYRTSQSYYSPSYSGLYDYLHCDQRKRLSWSVISTENSAVLQGKPQDILVESTVPTLFIKCHSHYFVEHNAELNVIWLNTPVVCPLLIEDSNDLYLRTLQSNDTIDIALTSSSLIALKIDHISVYDYAADKPATLHDGQTRFLPRSILGRRQFTCVSVDGDWMAVGGDGIVSLFLFSEGSWQFYHSLDRSPDTWFGYSVALSGSTLLISQLTSNEVFVYTLSSTSSWSLTQTLTVIEGGLFGFSLAIDGDVALIGVPRADVVYCYQHTAGKWTLRSKILPHAQDNNVFSHALTLSGHTAVIADDHSAHVYTWMDIGDGVATWQYQHSLTDVKSVEAVALSGDVLMILTSSTTVKVYNIATPTHVDIVTVQSRLRTAATAHITEMKRVYVGESTAAMSSLTNNCVWMLLTLCVVVIVSVRMICFVSKSWNDTLLSKEGDSCIV